MLILTRKPGESLYIGDNVKITIVEVKGHQIRVGIEAPTELRIYREEIYLQILEENRKAAEAARGTESGLESLSEAWTGIKSEGGQGGRPTIATLNSSKVKRDDPQVVIKRKRSKKEDE